MGLLHHRLQQLGKHRDGPLRVCIREGRAPNRIRTQMVKPRRMTRKPCHDLAQARRTGKLAVEQRHELALRRQPPHPRIGAMLFHKRIEPMPRNVLQQAVKYCIVMAHGADLHSCPGTLADVQDRIESTSCASSTKIQPDSRGLVPGIHVSAASKSKTWMAGSRPAMTKPGSFSGCRERLQKAGCFGHASHPSYSAAISTT